MDKVYDRWSDIARLYDANSRSEYCIIKSILIDDQQLQAELSFHYTVSPDNSSLTLHKFL